MAHLIGYARVSTHEQNADLQHDALTGAGCRRIFTDQASGSRDDRPKLAATLDQVLAGDTLIVWRLDRLGRSLPHLIETIAELERRGVGFRSVTEQIDTTTPGGRLVFHMFGALAEFERDLIHNRTHAGLAAARERGRRGGRPRALTGDKAAAATAMRAAGQNPTTIAATLGVSRATVYRHLTHHASPTPPRDTNAALTVEQNGPDSAPEVARCSTTAMM